MLELRDYQKQAIADVEQALQLHRRVVLGMPTGAGKTVTAAAMIHAHAQQSRKSLFIVDRRELVEQAAQHLEQIGLPKQADDQGEHRTSEPRTSSRSWIVLKVTRLKAWPG